jgi:hypothetical protein
MVSEAYKAAYYLSVVINYNDDDNNKINIWTNKVGSEKQCKKGEVPKTIEKML